MKDPMLVVDALDRIVDAIKEPDLLSVADASGLYAAARFLQRDLEDSLRSEEVTHLRARSCTTQSGTHRRRIALRHHQWP